VPAAAFPTQNEAPCFEKALRRCCAQPSRRGRGNQTAQRNSWSRRRWVSKQAIAVVRMRKCPATVRIRRKPRSRSNSLPAPCYRLGSGRTPIRPGGLRRFVPGHRSTPSAPGSPPADRAPGHAGWRFGQPAVDQSAATPLRSNQASSSSFSRGDARGEWLVRWERPAPAAEAEKNDGIGNRNAHGLVTALAMSHTSFRPSRYRCPSGSPGSPWLQAFAGRAQQPLAAPPTLP